MKTPVMLSLRSTQRYGEQEAEVLEQIGRAHV